MVLMDKVKEESRAIQPVFGYGGGGGGFGGGGGGGFGLNFEVMFQVIESEGPIVVPLPGAINPPPANPSPNANVPQPVQDIVGMVHAAIQQHVAAAAHPQGNSFVAPGIDPNSIEGILANTIHQHVTGLPLTFATPMHIPPATLSGLLNQQTATHQSPGPVSSPPLPPAVASLSSLIQQHIPDYHPLGPAYSMPVPSGLPNSIPTEPNSVSVQTESLSTLVQPQTTLSVVPSTNTSSVIQQQIQAGAITMPVTIFQNHVPSTNTNQSGSPPNLMVDNLNDSLATVQQHIADTQPYSPVSLDVYAPAPAPSPVYAFYDTESGDTIYEGFLPNSDSSSNSSDVHQMFHNPDIPDQSY